MRQLLYIPAIFGIGLFFRNKDKVADLIDAGNWDQALIYIVFGAGGVICAILAMSNFNSAKPTVESQKLDEKPNTFDSGEPTIIETQQLEEKSPDSGESTIETQQLEEKPTVPYKFTNDHLMALYKKTHEAWLIGKYSIYSDNYKTLAQEKSLEVFAISYRGIDFVINFAFRNIPPEDDETFTHAYYGQNWSSWLLTNKYFYSFALGSNDYKEYKVALSSIAEFEKDRWMLAHHILLKLKSGKSIRIEGMHGDDVNLICSHLIKHINKEETDQKKDESIESSNV